MKKIYSFFMVLMLMCIAAPSVWAQDIVYNDIDRSNWVPKAPPYSPTDNAVGIDGNVAGPEYLIDGKSTTFLALVKAGKTHNNVNGPSSIEELGFTIDLGSTQTFDYFRIGFNSGNSYTYLRPWVINLYGSNDSNEDPNARNWTLIKENFNIGGGDPGTKTLESNQTDKHTSDNFILESAVTYSSVKVVYVGMSPNSGGNTLQMAEFFLGSTSTDATINKPLDLDFADVLAGQAGAKTLTVETLNFAGTLTYTPGGDDAAAFTVLNSSFADKKGTATIQFAPTERRAYNATLTIDGSIPGVVDPVTINLRGNADFDLPIQISNDSEEHWYYIQFTRQAAAGTVLTIVNPDIERDTIQQLPLDPANIAQLWKITGTWDQYSVINKTANRTLFHEYVPVGEGANGNAIPEVNKYIAGEVGFDEDSFGFVRYNQTDTWQLKNTTSDKPYITEANKLYVNDQAGKTVCGYSLNNAGNQLTFIDANTPRIVVPGDTIKNTTVVPDGTTKELTLQVGGVQLSGNISVALTANDDNVFTLNTTSLPAAGGTVNYTYAPTRHKRTSYATITLTSGELTKTVVVTGTSDAGGKLYYIGAEGQWTGDRSEGILQETLPTSLVAKDELWIAEGQYTTGQLTLQADVKIYGGFKGTETSVNQRELVAGGKPYEFAHPSILTNSVALIFSDGAANTLVDGVTLEGSEDVNGRAFNITGGAGHIIRNSIIRNFNSGANDGGAFNVRSATKVEIYNNLITGNHSDTKGGGGYFDTGALIHDCDVTNNSTTTDGTEPVGNVNGCGGGLFLANGANVTVYNCYVAGNTATYAGGIFSRSGSRIYNCVIVDNTAAISGAGIAFDQRTGETNQQVYNVTIANNHSAVGGAGVLFSGKDNISHLVNTILWNNTDETGAVINLGNHNGATPKIRNVIIDRIDWYAQEENGGLNVTYGIIETDSAALFATNWTTAANSPAIDEGTHILVLETVDKDGNPVPAVDIVFATNRDFAGNARIINGTIDIGPYEYQNGVGIKNVTPEADGNVISTMYYTIQGIQVATPTTTGVYIKKEVLDTSKVRVTKLLFVAK